jgi:uncharacterized protein involved in exopolysaccharide biosynthesis
VLILFTLAGGLSLLIWSKMQTKLYTADAVMMPPQESQSGSSLMGQLSVLSVLGGSAGSKSPSDLYIGLMQSRSVLEKIASDFNLPKVYKIDKVESAAVVLGSRTKITSDKDGLISVKVEDQDPKRARDLANAFAGGLYFLNSRLAIGQAAQRRVFFDQQLALEKDHLADAEAALEQVEEKTGFIQLAGQTSATLSRVTQLQANIESRQLELASLHTSATDENPEVVRLQTELAGLRAQLASMQGKPGVDLNDSLGIPSARVPALSLEYIRKERDVQYHQTLFDLLARQLEAARIDEAKAAPIVQVVDHAELPVLPTFPKTKLFTVLGALLGFVLGCIRCVVLYIYAYIDEDPRLHIKWWAVKHELTGRLR